MNTMKKITNLGLALVLLVGTVAWAQPDGRRGGDPAERAERLTASMTELLSLDETQQNKVGDLNLEYAMKMKEVFQENQGDREAMRTTMQSLNEEKDTELAAILTEEQMQLYQEKKEEMRGKMRERRGDRKDRRKKDSASE